jgi:urea transport system permease protein
MYKIFIFAVAAMLAGLAGALYVPQVGIITPSQIGVLPSLEIVVWVATGGRNSLIGAILGAVGINAARSVLTARFPAWWPIILGSLFVAVVLLFPDGVVGIPRQCQQHIRRLRTRFATRGPGSTRPGDAGNAGSPEHRRDGAHEAARHHRVS